MKKTLSFLLLFLAVNLAFAQNDFATVNIYRTKAFCIGCSVKILLNDVYLTDLENGGKLELKIFNTNGTKITVTDGKSYRDDVLLKPRKGQVFHFNAQARTPRALGFRLDQLDKSVKERKLRSDRFLTMSDVGVLDNNTSRKPDTEWTELKLKEYWTENGSKVIEGIYEKVGTTLEYELAVLKENNEYKIIYLDGAKGTSWNEGDIKATLQKTAQFGLFKANWFMLNKSFNNDVIITFENATMSLIPETGRDKDIYIKIFPTYDESNTTEKSEWKGTGTGFFIDKKGYLVTNYHVVEDGKIFEVTVSKDGITNEYKTEIISVDKQNDLAILKIIDNSFIPFKSLNYKFSTNTKNVGTSVFALGFPLTQYMGNEIKMTDGIISSKSGFKGDITNYQISVPIQPGNSGGPLFDKKGNLVGITSSGLDKSKTDNVNYAIKTSYLKLLIDSLDDNIELPNYNTEKELNLEDLNNRLNEYVVLIKVK